MAWIACPTIGPDPNGPEPIYHLWQVPIDIAALTAIVWASVALWRGSRRAPVVGVAAGLGMVVETVLCPGTRHHLIVWYTWAQTALSAFVLLTSAGLLIGRPRRPRVWKRR